MCVYAALYGLMIVKVNHSTKKFFNWLKSKAIDSLNDADDDDPVCCVASYTHMVSRKQTCTQTFTKT